MHAYLVGGAVRDGLLGLPVTERDWVVVGATPEQMLVQGFRQVGRDFPVFLHPDSHEEYALARTERKQGQGYHGFVVHADPGVTLEEDLARRDLTINAMAQAADGRLIDPYHGLEDLQARCLRHVGPAFEEDPLRVLRVARFAARLSGLGFVLAAETRQLMVRMSANGELDSLTPERVWMETVKALQSPRPSMYFQLLHEVGALAVLMPELARLFQVPQDPRVHPEGNAGVHSLMVLDAARCLTDEVAVLWAALLHDLGKGVTPPGQWPDHTGHEVAGVSVVRQLCERLRVPKEVRELAETSCRWHGDVHRVARLEPEQRLAVLDGVDVWRRPERFDRLLLVCQADAAVVAGQGGDYAQAAQWHVYQQCMTRVEVSQLVAQGVRGLELKAAIRARRLECLT